jgi:hypothetical protein
MTYGGLGGSLQLPFDTRQFFEVFALYNTAVWPAQVVLWLAAVGMAVLPLWRRPAAGRIIAFFLGGVWLWMGAVYQLVFFRAINPAATAFGLAFLLEGGLFVAYGWRGQLRFGWTRGAAGVVGAVLILYALLAYPIVGYVLGHRFPVSPTIGLPCPTVILTLGLLALTEPPRPRAVFVIPMLWSLLGAEAAVEFGMWEDLALPVAAALVLGFVLLGDRATVRSTRRGVPLEVRPGT